MLCTYVSAKICDPYKSLEPPYLRYCTCHVFSFFNEHEFSIKFFVCGNSNADKVALVTYTHSYKESGQNSCRCEW